MRRYLYHHGVIVRASRGSTSDSSDSSDSSAYLRIEEKRRKEKGKEREGKIFIGGWLLFWTLSTIRDNAPRLALVNKMSFSTSKRLQGGGGEWAEGEEERG